MKKSTLTWNRLTLGTAGLCLWAGLASCGSPLHVLPNSDTSSPSEPVPELPVTTATSEPPAISGGTLLITRDDHTAVAADPDRDAVWLVDLQQSAVRKRVVLPAGSEPGRAVEDRDGNIHVATRRGGQLVKINPQSGKILSSRAVCAAPRGVAYSAASDSLYVACNGGELVTLPAQDGGVTRTLYLDRDLRDVVIKDDHLLVSRFRSAELIDVSAAGDVVGRVKPRQSPALGVIDTMGKPATTSPSTAWRTRVLSDGSVLMLHQRALDNTISTKSGGYGSGPCKSGIVTGALTLFSGGGSGGALSVGSGGIAMTSAMVVDIAVAPDGQQVAMISAGGSTAIPVSTFSRSALNPADGCQPPNIMYPSTPGDETQFTAGAYDSKAKLWVQARNPAGLYAPSSSTHIPFAAAEDRSSEGHRIFHSPTKAAIACASCHAEGGDDGHVWNFDGVGPRRTQTLRGGLLATAPFHWDGDMTDLGTLMTQVFSGRMSGVPLTPAQVTSVGAWVDAQPALPRGTPRDPAAVIRGKAIFENAGVGCAGCHSGAHFTSNQSVLVGTGKAFQVPALTDVASRAPYLHTGCAATLRDRFDPACGGGDSHGKTSQLAPAQLDDLVAYLETL